MASGQGRDGLNNHCHRPPTGGSQNKIDYLENQSRCNNLCLEGIPESPRETWSTTVEKLTQFITTLGLPLPRTERAHQLAILNWVSQELWSLSSPITRTEKAFCSKLVHFVTRTFICIRTSQHVFSKIDKNCYPCCNRLDKRDTGHLICTMLCMDLRSSNAHENQANPTSRQLSQLHVHAPPTCLPLTQPSLTHQSSQKEPTMANHRPMHQSLTPLSRIWLGTLSTQHMQPIS